MQMAVKQMLPHLMWRDCMELMPLTPPLTHSLASAQTCVTQWELYLGSCSSRPWG